RGRPPPGWWPREARPPAVQGRGCRRPESGRGPEAGWPPRPGTARSPSGSRARNWSIGRARPPALLRHVALQPRGQRCEMLLEADHLAVESQGHPLLPVGFVERRMGDEGSDVQPVAHWPQALDAETVAAVGGEGRLHLARELRVGPRRFQLAME